MHAVQVPVNLDARLNSDLLASLAMAMSTVHSASNNTSLYPSTCASPLATDYSFLSDEEANLNNNTNSTSEEWSDVDARTDRSHDDNHSDCDESDDDGEEDDGELIERPASPSSISSEGLHYLSQDADSELESADGALDIGRQPTDLSASQTSDSSTHSSSSFVVL